MRGIVLTVIAILFILPLSLQREFRVLENTSKISVCMTFLIFMVPVYKYIFQHNDIVNMDGQIDYITPNWLTSFGLMCYPFACHHTIFLTHGTLEYPSTKRWERVTFYGVGFACFLQLLIATVGYFT